jgi:hypothetical protein
LHENLLCVSPQAGKDSRAVCSSSMLKQYAAAASCYYTIKSGKCK